ncbi:PepSY domain-containing protein, partial [Actinocorallia lasiicapitis]
ARHAGLSGPIEVTARPGEAWVVAQNDRRWPVRLDRVAVDPRDGRIVARADWATESVLVRWSTLGSYAHRGRLFGPAGQVVLAFLAVGTLALIGYGYRSWWQRRPTRADRRAPFGKPPARGAWRRLPALPRTCAAVGALLLGWALPALGVSLLVFLLFDSLFLFLRKDNDATSHPDRRAPADPGGPAAGRRGRGRLRAGALEPSGRAEHQHRPMGPRHDPGGPRRP